MKKIFVKQFNALFDYPMVNEPNYNSLRNLYDCATASIILQEKRNTYNKWLSSKIEIVGEHHFEDGELYEKDVHYKKVWYNHGGFDKPDNYGWAIIPINILNRV